MIEQDDLIKLKFKRVDVTAEESGYATDWYYYTYDFDKCSLSLISSDSTEADNIGWYVEVYDDDSISFKTVEELAKFIAIVEKNMV